MNKGTGFVLAGLLIASCGSEGSISPYSAEDLDYDEAAPTASELAAVAYEPGPYEVISHNVPKKGLCRRKGYPAVETRVHAPVASGTYPVVMLVSCLVCFNWYLDDVLQHVASHGFVVVVPKTHTILDVMTTSSLTALDVEATVEAAAWVRDDLNDYMLHNMPTRAMADPSSLALVGYSSGGKAAWAIAIEQRLELEALCGLTPVDGTGDPFGWRPEDPIINGPFEIDLPVLIIGTGHDSDSPFDGFPACAPEGSNHASFFEASRAPAWHVVAETNGHTDVVNEEMSWLLNYVCPTEGVGEQMRGLSKGMLSAFFLASLSGETDMYRVLTDVASAPAPISVGHKALPSTSAP